MIDRLFERLERRCDKFDHYFPLYERWLSRFVGQAPRILEIGVQFGGSAELWRRWFGEGTLVHGIDIEPRCAETDYLQIVVGDQGSPEFWETFLQHVPLGTYDIVIDDGSHDNPHQIQTLIHAYNLLKDGGVYWCEDTHTSYYRGVRVRDGGLHNPGSFVEFSKRLIDVIHSAHTHYAIDVGPTDGPHVDAALDGVFDRIQGIHFHDSVVVIEKGERPAFRRRIHEPAAVPAQ
jgi:hypothetical protein